MTSLAMLGPVPGLNMGVDVKGASGPGALEGAETGEGGVMREWSGRGSLGWDVWWGQSSPGVCHCLHRLLALHLILKGSSCSPCDLHTGFQPRTWTWVAHLPLLPLS